MKLFEIVHRPTVILLSLCYVLLDQSRQTHTRLCTSSVSVLDLIRFLISSISFRLDVFKPATSRQISSINYFALNCKTLKELNVIELSVTSLLLSFFLSFFRVLSFFPVLSSNRNTYPLRLIIKNNTTDE